MNSSAPGQCDHSLCQKAPSTAEMSAEVPGTFFTKLFDTSDFPARWYCGTWSLDTGWMHIISDIAIFGAYFAIPVVLLYFLLQRKDLPFPKIIWLFAAFILFCGFGHLVEAGIFWWPVYRFSGLIKACTAIVSWITVLVLIRLIPEAAEIDSLEKAILLMGPHSIGELAILYGARRALLECNLPWLNPELLWKRSFAASKAVRIIERTQFADSDGSAFLCALLHPIGRIVLATLFPDEHRELTKHCLETGESLDLAEEASFGLSYGQVGARFFSTWRIPATTRLPLENVTRTFEELISLPDHTRKQIEIVKLALLLSRTAMGLWESSDSVDVPHKARLNKFNMPSIQRMLCLIREACDFEVTIHQLQSASGTDQPSQPMTVPIEYHSAAGTSSDLLFPLLASVGLQINDQRLELAHCDLVDGASLGGEQLRHFIDSQNAPNPSGIIRNKRDASLFKPGSTICLPTTVKKIRTFFAM
ncbi:MAG: HDOD domain-containing protein [Planctomycetota bacterium]